MNTARNSRQLGFQIQHSRKQQGLTQQELAQRAGIRQPTLSDIENGKRAYSDTLFRVLNSLGLELILSAVSDCEIFNPEEFYDGKK